MRIRIFLQTGGLNSDLLLLLTLGFFNIAAALDQDLSAQPRIVAQTERAFSARCAEIGIRDSFLEYFAVDAIHFEPEPRLARPDFERESSSTGLRLTWEPKIIRVASSGQLAVSTGPYVLRRLSGNHWSAHFRTA
jgi:hypothetical protein